MKKITILALHLGYGGIENAIATLANLLSKDYEVEIISTYKLYSEPVFKINDNVKITYLMENIKPNKKELDYYKKNKNYSMFIKECFKSIKVLHLRRKLMIDSIKKLEESKDFMLNNHIISKDFDINSWVDRSFYEKANK